MERPEKLFGIEVTEEGSVKTGALLSVVVGGPLYAWILEGEAWINFAGRTVTRVWSGIFAFTARWIETLIGAPEAGFAAANRTFALAVSDFGVAAYIVSIIVASAVVALILVGVTRVI